MLTDNEITLIEEDKLNFESYAITICNTILKSKTPLTVGIHGEWGSGKSSLMKLVQVKIDEDEINKTIWFNAWKFDKTLDLRVALINRVLRKIESDIKNDKNLLAKVKLLSKRINWWGLGKKATTVGSLALGSMLTGLPLFAALSKPVKAGIDAKDIIPDKIIKEEDNANDIELIGEFEEKFQEIVSEYIKNNGRLVIFIDDLDRCIPEKAIEILESIKLFLNVENTVFVIGTDKKVIELGISQRYGQESFRTWGRDYIDKIIQVPFRIPPISIQDIREFINNLGNDAIAHHSEIISAVGDNPRKIKRLLNNFELQKELARTRNLIIDNHILAKLNVLEFRWIEFFEEFMSQMNDHNENILKIFLEYEELNDEERLREFRDENPNIKNYLLNSSLRKFIDEVPSLSAINNIEDYIFLTNTVIPKETYSDLNLSASFDNVKGKFGERNEGKNRKLTATVTGRTTLSRNKFRIDLKLESTDKINFPLTGTVTFHLHHTFKNSSIRIVNVENSKAKLTIYAYGAFTVGAVIDNENTSLELDLTTIPGAPMEFIEN
jgi:KAP family P-loop domain/prokaryotic YEATS domain